MDKWKYKGADFELNIEDWCGFVYLITSKSTGRMYVGKKIFWNTRYLPKTKKRKRRKKVKRESDWKSYFGSNKELIEEIEKNGSSGYHREILFLCNTKSEMGYIEADEQFKRKVLLDDNYYNGNIQCRINSKHVEGSTILNAIKN